jgi:hypothetical protein
MCVPFKMVAPCAAAVIFSATVGAKLHCEKKTARILVPSKTKIASL